MDKKIKELMTDQKSSDDKTRILGLTDKKVDWTYDVWDELFKMLEHENSFHRSIAIKVISNLAKSDTEDRIYHSLGLLLANTKDDKFITSRIWLKSIWKVAAASRKSRKKVLTRGGKRFRECSNGKHYNLLRTDIIQSIRLLYDAERNQVLLTLAQTLIIGLVVVTGLAVVVLFASGAFMSIGNVRYETVKLIHNIAPVIVVLAIGSVWRIS